jgi:DNA-binding MarR family transcriptional regulator
MPNPDFDPMTRLVLAVFRAQQSLSADGDQLAAGWDLTSAKWKVLGAIAVSGQALSAAAIGRTMGLSRQAAIKQANLLVEQRMLSRRPDPADARAPLHDLTSKGRAAYEAVTAAWVRRAEHLSAGLEAIEIERAGAMLAELVQRLDAEAPKNASLNRRTQRGNKS